MAVSLGLALAIQALVVKPYRIPSGSMKPTLSIGERVLVNRIGARLGSPEVGDIVVFHPPTGAQTGRCGIPRQDRAACARPTSRSAEANYIKRVVAGPGDRLAIRDGQVVLNGAPQAEPLVRRCDDRASCDLPQPITVPAEHYFVMGDNRGGSSDSRFWGPVPEEWIVGETFATYWPPGQIGLL